MYSSLSYGLQCGPTVGRAVMFSTYEPHPAAPAAGVARCAAAARRMAASGGAGKMASQVASTRSSARRSPGRDSQMAPNTCQAAIIKS